MAYQALKELIDSDLRTRYEGTRVLRIGAVPKDDWLTVTLEKGRKTADFAVPSYVEDHPDHRDRLEEKLRALIDEACLRLTDR